ncbi:hypothetical protein AJ78_00426 [Emergomyces pasteurianus Ep9510]|uniref:Uncharacterized protein n=1 Tax=Emergomyces pasteurianus Ep9510 TaxID=1447872 RepID=A0A1J9PT28_9EURO|nr:hypothetical protein AJ78_00426 [Emergomyces pasteurianus Ep9510]
MDGFFIVTLRARSGLRSYTSGLSQIPDRVVRIDLNRANTYDEHHMTDKQKVLLTDENEESNGGLKDRYGIALQIVASITPLLSVHILPDFFSLQTEDVVRNGKLDATYIFKLHLMNFHGYHSSSSIPQL